MAFNILGFQAVWWACVLGAGAGWAWAGPLAAVAFAVLHLHATPTRARDLRLMVAAMLLGLVLDSGLAASGLLVYAASGGSDVLAPAWILALWAGFALTLTHSLAWFAQRPLAAALFGLVGGPLAYAGAGTVAAAVAFPQGGVIALVAVASCWAVAMPLLYAVDRRFDAAQREAWA
jgi:hypothetical protein